MDITLVQLNYLVQQYELERELQDYRAALVAATICNVNRRKGKKAYKVKDFMPKYGEGGKETATPDELKMKVQMINAMFGGTVNGKQVR